MKKIIYGTPEELVPSRFCKTFCFQEKQIHYDIDRIRYRQTDRGVRLEIPLDDGEMVYGFGLQLHGFNHKGRKIVCRVNADAPAYTGDSHAPVPFFATTKGLGVYVDTAREATFYCGYRKKEQISETSRQKRLPAITTGELYDNALASGSSTMVIEVPAPGVAIYVMEGNTITDVVAQYNMLSGGGCEVPQWGLGPIYRCGSRYTDREVLNMADYFREKQIPISVIGLEPGWQSQAYPCSFIWDAGRFPNPQELVGKLKKMGYHINLWEHAFVHQEAPFYEKIEPYSGDYTVWGGLVPDFASEEARKTFADHHRLALVDAGIDGFKLDECDSSDYTEDWSFPHCSSFPSGLDGEQYHALLGTLYAQTIMDALGEHKTLSEIRTMGALAASYPFVLYSDLYDHRDFIRGTVNSGFSGILWTPEVRDAVSREDFLRRLQSNIFSVQCIINAWYCKEAPWLSWDCEEELRRLLEVRMNLIPMLKEAFARYHEKGIPPVRALVMDYTDDPETYNIDDEYIFCRDLLVAPIVSGKNSRRVYLPKAERWYDWWTGEKVESGWHEVITENIPVFCIRRE